MSQAVVHLGAFDLLHPVARGGMGVVFEARHRRQDTQVIVKVALDEYATDGDFREAFRRECQAMARLSHRSVVTVLDIGEVDEDAARASGGQLVHHTPYVAMERIEGVHLSEVGVDIGWPAIHSIISDLLGALAHAHARGVLHRDLKPTNVLVQASPPFALKLLDFGISAALERRPRTDTLTVAGTPNYMAPEQIVGEWHRQGPFTDLYGLGCLLWRWLCGRAPFAHSADAESTLAAHLFEPLPPFRPNTAVPEGFPQWMARLLEKEPRARFRRAADAAHALTSLLSAQLIVPGATPTRRPIPKSQTRPAPSVESRDAPTLIQQPLSSEPRTSRTPLPIVSWSAPPIAARPLDSYRTQPTLGIHGAGLGLFGLRTTPLVGRDLERTRLWDALLGVVQDKRPRAILLQGPVGCGKTRLSEWFGQLAHEVGAASVLECTHSRSGSPEDGIAPMVMRHFRCWETTREQTLACVHGELAEREVTASQSLVFEGITELILSAQPQGANATPPSVRFGSARERHAVVFRWLASMVRERAVILRCDDAQWAGDFIQFLDFLVSSNESEPLPILIVLTAQPKSLEDSPAARQGLIELEAGGKLERIDLRPLLEQQQRELVQNLLPLESSLAGQIVSSTQGNPLFAVQVLEDWVDRGVLQVGNAGFVVRPQTTAVVPKDLDEAWQRRLEQLVGPATPVTDERRSIEIAAALGRSVRDEEWRAACELAGVTASAPLIDAMVRAGLAHRSETGWSFVHAMLREALEQSAVQGERVEQHHRFCAEALGALHDPSTIGFWERRAQHLVAARDHEAALSPLLDAAVAAYHLGSHGAVETLLAQRSACMDELHIAAEDPRRSRNAWLGGAVAWRRGDVETASRAAGTVIDAAQRHGWNAELGLGLELRGSTRIGQGDAPGGIEDLRRASQLLEESGEWDTLVLALNNLALHLCLRGEYEEARTYVAKGVEKVGRASHPALAAVLYITQARIHMDSGDPERAAEVGETARLAARRVGNRRAEAFTEIMLGELARHSERWFEAHEHYRRAAEVLRSQCDERAEQLVRINMIIVAVALDDFAGAAAAIDALPMARDRRIEFLLLKTASLCIDAGTDRWQDWSSRLEEVHALSSEHGLRDSDLSWLATRAAGLARKSGHLLEAARAEALAEAVRPKA